MKTLLSIFNSAKYYLYTLIGLFFIALYGKMKYDKDKAEEEKEKAEKELMGYEVIHANEVLTQNEKSSKIENEIKETTVSELETHETEVSNKVASIDETLSKDGEYKIKL